MQNKFNCNFDHKLMKQLINYMKEIGIVFTYILMLVACYFFNWKPFGIFISYLIEIVVLLIVYSFVRLKDEKKNPQHYRKTQPLANIYIGIIPLLLIQFIIIGFMTLDLNPEENFIKQNLLLTKEVFFSVCSILVIYVLKALQFSTNKERLVVFQDNFLFKILALTSVNILCFIIVSVFEKITLIPLLTAMIIFRILLELYFSRKMKFI